MFISNLQGSTNRSSFDSFFLNFRDSLQKLQRIYSKSIFDQFVHSQKSPQNKKLTTEYFFIPSDQSQNLLVSISGVHGAEAYIGSMIQNQIIQMLCDPIEQNLNRRAVLPNLLFIHNFNSYGSAWVRRGNHCNIDLNRNSWHLSPPTNDSFSRYHQLLQSNNYAQFIFEFFKLVPDLLKIGLPKVSSDLASGQKEDSNSLFYSGLEPSEETLYLREYLKNMPDFDKIAVLDIHTGLGAYASESLILEPAQCEVADKKQLEIKLNTKFIDQNSFGFYKTNGLLGENFSRRFSKSKLFYLTQEFGTYNFLKILFNLSQELRLWQKAKDLDPKRTLGQLECFFPNDLDWQTQTLRLGCQRFFEIQGELSVNHPESYR